MCNRVAVNALNKAGIPCLLYLDDRIIFMSSDGKFDGKQTLKGAYMMAAILVALGGFLSLDKCEWTPTQIIEFLGMNIDSRDLSVAVPEAKYNKCMAEIELFYTSRPFNMKNLEKIRGKLNSWRIVAPNLGLFLRECDRAIAECYRTGNFNWAEEQMTQFNIFEELSVWADLKLVALKRIWTKEAPILVDIDLYSDASGFAAGGLLTKPNEKTAIFGEAYFQFNELEADVPIHVKEILAVLLTLEHHGSELHNKTVQAWCDNQGIVDCFRNGGGSDLRVSRILKQIVEYCHVRNILLKVDWKCSKEQLADGVSRSLNFGECKLRPELAVLVERVFGPELDLFAASTNKLKHVPTYCSKAVADEDSKGNAFNVVVNKDTRTYSFPPDRIQNMAIDNAVDRFDKLVMVINTAVVEKAVMVKLASKFDYRVKIGHKQRPAVLRPAKNKAVFDGEKTYFTGNLTVAASFLYIKGYPASFVRRYIRFYEEALYWEKLCPWLQGQLARGRARNKKTGGQWMRLEQLNE